MFIRYTYYLQVMLGHSATLLIDKRNVLLLYYKMIVMAVFRIQMR